MKNCGEKSLAKKTPSWHLCAILRYFDFILKAGSPLIALIQALVSGLHSQDDRRMILSFLVIEPEMTFNFRNTIGEIFACETSVLRHADT